MNENLVSMSFDLELNPIFNSNISNKMELIDNYAQLLEDSVILHYDIKQSNVYFELLRKMGNNWVSSQLIIQSIDQFYFQHFETGLLREGIHNLKKLASNSLSEEVAHISTMSYWQHLMSKNEGIQLAMYSGKMLRFIGDNLSLSINDGEVVENKFKTPEFRQTSLIKLIFHNKYIRKTKNIISDVKSKMLKAESERQLLDYEIKEEDLTVEQRLKADEILKRIQNEDEENEEIFSFED